MPRSVKVHQKSLEKVKALLRHRGYPRQKDLANELELSLATISNFLNGKAVDCLNFQEICDKLGLDWKEVADYSSSGSGKNGIENKQLQTSGAVTFLDELDMEGQIYVERPPIESICYNTLRQPGALLRIKAPGSMGKTSLLNQILPKLEHEGYSIVFLNLHNAEEKDFSNLNKFLQWLCVSVGEDLEIPNRLAEYWDDEYSTSKINCKSYFEQYLLKQLEAPIVLCLDEVERVFSHPVATEFLGLLRAWHEDAQTPRSIWRKLRLVVIHSTEVYVKLNVNESPFNVGVDVKLEEFTPEQVKNLAERCGLDWNLAQVIQLMDMVGGHPYLLVHALNNLKRYGGTLEKLLQNAPTEAGIYHNHLQHCWMMLQQNKEDDLGLMEALKKVITTSQTVQLKPMQGFQLSRLGLVQQVGNKVKIACKLYQLYFSYRFGIN